MVEHAGLDASLFALDPDEFIDTCAQRLGLTESEFPDADRAALRAALYAGRPRFAVIDALLRHKGPDGGRRDAQSPLAAVTQDAQTHLVADVLLRLSPGDDATFLMQVFRTIVGRMPQPFERQPLLFDLRHGRIDRAGVIERLLVLARREGRVVYCTPVTADGAAGMVAGADGVSPAPYAGLDADGRVTLALCRRNASGGWDIPPDGLRQSPRVADDVWHLRPGFVLAGPQAALPPGRWKITLDLAQDDDAVVTLDAVANSGLDQLARTDIVGCFDGAVGLLVGRHHHFVEIRLFKPRQSPGLMWLRLGRLTATRLGDLPERK